MAEIVCAACGYRVNILRTGPNSAKPEHDIDEFERLCREGPFVAATGACISTQNIWPPPAGANSSAGSHCPGEYVPELTEKRFAQHPQ